MSSDKRYDALENLRRALEGRFVSTRWRYAGCGTVETDDDEPYVIAHPEPIDHTAEFIAAADPDTIRQLIADYDALTARVEAAERDARRLEAALRDGLSVCASVSTSGDRRVMRGGCPMYLQTEEWCRWVESLEPTLRAAIDAASGQSTGETE